MKVSSLECKKRKYKPLIPFIPNDGSQRDCAYLVLLSSGHFGLKFIDFSLNIVRHVVVVVAAAIAITNVW